MSPFVLFCFLLPQYHAILGILGFVGVDDVNFVENQQDTKCMMSAPVRMEEMLDAPDELKRLRQLLG